MSEFRSNKVNFPHFKCALCPRPIWREGGNLTAARHMALHLQPDSPLLESTVFYEVEERPEVWAHLKHDANHFNRYDER
jgi:hypothetical protein